ncbi:MAG: hypothetical protein C9356_10270 [Oleiphilus sp.]|nr:MAG: hypothetical protein C9356_10270 [Oleiphilus sp.]
MSRYTKFCIFLCFLSTATFAQPTEPTKSLSPTELIPRVITEVTTDMRANEAQYTNNQARLEAMVDQRVAPYFHFGRITQLVLGKYSSQVTDEQKSQLIPEFRRYLIRSYAKILFQYRDSTAEIMDEQRAAENKTTLKLKIKNKKGDPATLILRLEKIKENWQVIDVNVEGVSVLVTIRSQFSEQIEKRGIDGLIEYLKAQNQSAENKKVAN